MRQAFDKPTDEWLPAWLLEEAAVEGDQHDGSVVVVGNKTSGPPGTEAARRAAMVDGCTIIKVCFPACVLGSGLSYLCRWTLSPLSAISSE